MKARAAETLKSYQQRAQGLQMVESYAFYEFNSFFASEILWLILANVYGTVSVFISRNNSDGTTDPFNTMGFGQIVRLMLLVIPVYAALEAGYGGSRSELFQTQSTKLFRLS
jgi:hypothetical protein